MKTLKIKISVVITILAFMVVGCTDLDEKLNDRLTLEQVKAVTSGATPDVSSLLAGAYDKLLDVHGAGQENMSAHTGDLLMAPTRGGDWDDNGAWRALHQHTWDSEHATLKTYFNRLTSGLFAALDLLQFSPNTQQEAEARFLRAFFVFWIADGWGQVPIREPGESLTDVLPTVMSSSEAIDFVITELETVKSNLPLANSTNPWVATQEAASALLAKAYLNRAVFKSEDRQTFSFDAADMDKVIAYCDEIINSGNYALEDVYFENFTSDNGENSTEIIFCSNNEAGIESNNIRGQWMSGLHYNQTPSGWNGFTTLADFYNSFETGDQRRRTDFAELQSTTGLNAGFLAGQQYDSDGAALEDRQGNPLVFTEESPIITFGDILEVSGIRIIKFVPDMDMEDVPGNDFPFFRYGDILLTKAEALLRKGDNAGALTLVNDVRTIRDASTLSSISEAELLAERARELYQEGWRRNDLVRFGKFLDAWNEKEASDPKYLLYPFPSTQIVANPNLIQNPGY